MAPLMEEWELRTDFQAVVSQMLMSRDHLRLLEHGEDERYTKIQDRNNYSLLEQLKQARVTHREWLLRLSTNMVLLRSSILLKKALEDPKILQETESEALGDLIARTTGLGAGAVKA
jgi:hypothetical protein